MSRMISACGELVGRARLDVTAVADDGDDVGDLADLLEPVADVEDRDAAVAQAAHRGEEVVDLVGRERGGRLVHDQQARARRQRLRDLEQLPVGDAEAAHRRVRVDVDRRSPRGCGPSRPASRPSRRCRSGCAGGARRRRSRRRSDPRRPSAPGTSRRCPARCAACGSEIRLAEPSIATSPSSG